MKCLEFIESRLMHVHFAMSRLVEEGSPRVRVLSPFGEIVLEQCAVLDGFSSQLSEILNIRMPSSSHRCPGGIGILALLPFESVVVAVTVRGPEENVAPQQLAASSRSVTRALKIL